MKNMWNDADVEGKDVLEQLVYASRLFGNENALVLWGGGNTSVKREEFDHLGRRMDVLRIKGSGSDLKVCDSKDFPGVRLAEVRELFTHEEMSDEEMVAFIERCMVEPRGSRPSIETLLHAFVPDEAVIHSHADAILALVDSQNWEETIRRVYGDSVLTVPYIRPGFAMAKMATSAISRAPKIRGLILMHHGLLTWGETVQEAYTRHLELVSLAENYLRKGATVEISREPRWTEEVRQDLKLRLAPLIRRAMGGGEPRILQVCTDEATLRFVERIDVEPLTRRGVATPDHILHTKRVPVVIPAESTMSDDELERLVDKRIDDFKKEYEASYRRYNATDLPMREPLPIIALVPGLGFWAIGRDPELAQVAHDVYRHNIDIMEWAESCGGYRTIDESQAFDVEYWPLELYRLALRPPGRELTGRVALITGAARGIGAAIAERFAQEGAVVVLGDRLVEDAVEMAEKIQMQYGPRSALAVPLDVTDEIQVTQAVEQIVSQYGGIDILVSNAGIAPTGALADLSRANWDHSLAINLTGHFLVTREVVKVMRRQRMGGSLVYIVSKNALVPGKEFGAYSVAKAGEAQLARIAAIEHGRDGIRANMINPDAIWTELWSPDVRADRAQAYNIAESELEEFYRHRSLLDRLVTVTDVAEAALFFASNRSDKTTGAILPVDAGIREGFPR
ncbi:MAG: bifunctional rhamnulose-1-phosphate aldolase/short-chain dehydrogenase [Bacilli bacterium]